jgi:hypothetical protein
MAVHYSRRLFRKFNGLAGRDAEPIAGPIAREWGHPSAFMINSNLVDYTTARSEGLMPLRMLPVRFRMISRKENIAM